MEKILITEVCDILVGRTPSRYNPVYWGAGFPWLSIADMNQGESIYSTKETITTDAVTECKCKMVPKGTVLFSFKLSIGKVGITAIDMFTNEAIAAFLIKDKSRLDTKFLFYTLKSTDYSVGSNKAVMGKTLNKEQLKKFTIPLPSIEEQYRIVKILDLAQSLIEKRKQAIAYLDDYIKAVFLDMFGDPVSNPKGWEVKTIQAISHKITDGEHLNPTFSEGGMPMIMAGHVLESGVDTKSARKVSSELGRVFRKKCNPEKNDLLLVSRGATIGRLCRVTTSELFCLMGSVILIKPDHDIINSAFLSELLKHPRMYSKLFNSSGSSAQQAIYLKDIKKLNCVIPPIEDQKDFEKIVLEIDSIKQKMQTQLKELEDNFQAQLQRAFRGE